MKLQCDLCREIVVADFAVAAGAIEVHCPSCHKTFQVTATRGEHAQLASQPPPAPLPHVTRTGGPMTCPKCGDSQPEAPACRSCGLLAAKMPEYARTSANVAPELEAAWTRAEAEWRDPAAHDRVHAAAAASNAFAWAAQRYRDRVRADPSDTVAAEQLARLARTAEVTLLATAAKKQPDKNGRPYRGPLAVLVVLMVVIAVGFGYALFAGRLREDPGGPPTSPQPKVKPAPHPAPRPTGR